MSQISNLNELIPKQETQVDLDLPFCICCLVQNGPFISISSCIHADFLDLFPILKDDDQLKKNVCEDCHFLMKKIYYFKLQIQETCNFLSKKIHYIDKFEQHRRNISLSKVVHHNIPAINEGIDCPADENSNKIKNIETALNILNTNTNSLESCDLKSMTEVLLQMTANTLNLESSTKVLPDNKKISDHEEMLPSFENVPNKNMESVLPVDIKVKSEYILTESVNNSKKAIDDNTNNLSVKIKKEVDINETALPEMKTNLDIDSREVGVNCSASNTLADDNKDGNTTSISTAFLPIKLDKDELMKEREAKMKSEDISQWPYRCEHCIIGFQYKENLDYHNKRYHRKPTHEEISEETETVSDNPAYNDVQLNECIDLIKSNTLTQKAAAAYYNIPEKVIKSKLKAKNKKKERPPVFLDDEELLIANHIIGITKYGFNITKSIIRMMIQNYLESENKIVYRFRHNVPSKGWIRSFLKRHPSIYQYINRSPIRNWKDAVVEFFKTFGKEIEAISPQNIYSYDEISFSDDLSRKAVVWKRGAKYPDTLNGPKPSFSVIFCGNAAGEYISPYMVHKSKYFWPTWTRKGPDGTRYNITRTGYIDAYVFEDWFFNHVLQALQKKEGKKLLIGSDFPSHISVKVWEKCVNSNISFICLPAAAVNALNPLDIAYFRPLKVKWEEILIAGNSENYFTNPEADFARMLKRALRSLLLKENLIAAFRWTGLCPVDARIPLVWFSNDDYIHDYSINSVDPDPIASVTLTELLTHNERYYKINIGYKRKLATSFEEQNVISDTAQAGSSKVQGITQEIPKKMLKFED